MANPMSAIQSNTDALLVAIPMVGLMFAGFFRVDELVGKSQKTPSHRSQIGGLDERGFPICLDPDGDTPRKKPKAA
jgi:hypothetical protein